MPFYTSPGCGGKPPLILDGLVEKTSAQYIAIGEHSDLFAGKLTKGSQSVVAIKVLRGATSTRDEFRQRFKQELCTVAEIWRQLECHYVANFYGIADDQGMMPALVSTFYPKGNVIEYIKETRAPADKRIELLRDIADGLNYLHAFNPPVIHGDLRGNNVLITEDGHAVISDYGLSFIIQSSEFTSVKTAGTCRWTAPEIMNPPQDAPSDSPSVPYSCPGDVYAWAMTALEIFTEKPPFHQKKNDSAVIFLVIEGKRPELPHDITSCPGLKRLVEKCWEQDPNERPSSVEMLEEMNGFKCSFFQWCWFKTVSYLRLNF